LLIWYPTFDKCAQRSQRQYLFVALEVVPAEAFPNVVGVQSGTGRTNNLVLAYIRDQQWIINNRSHCCNIHTVNSSQRS